jgi:type VI secretion system secreted protein VgrG
MATITQAGQPIRIGTTLGDDELLFEQLTGTEAMSAPFEFHVDLLSEDAGINGADLLRTPMVLTFDLPNGEKRYFHGICSRFSAGGKRDELTNYRAEIVPWFWLLQLSADVKIFQNMSVIEIIESVFKTLGYGDFEFKCTGTYAKREYCVQYRESHFNFVSRLMEEEGIFYFFKHTSSKHTMVIADNPDAVSACPGESAARLSGEPLIGEDVVLDVSDRHSVFIGKVTLADYDYLNPSLRLNQSQTGDGVEEIYDYPGPYTTPDDGDRYALVRLQAREAQARVLTGNGTFRAFQSGHTFDLKGHHRKDGNGKYLLTRIEHSASAGSYRAWQDNRQPSYTNTFTCIPAAVPYRPERHARKPVVHGSQTAMVVGKGGEEIFVDPHGRVKVQFYWDREGKKDENSSCWVRVSSMWAGKGWGWIQIPRIGQEVIVDFLEGDPDRPIITGRVYNAEQTPPYDLPANQTQSGIKSRSSKGGGTDNFNEIRFEDLKGSEVVYVHAEKDMETMVENDRKKDVGNDETNTIGNDRTTSVGNDQTLSVTKNRTESIGENESLSVGGNRTESIDKNDSLTVTGNRSKSVTKDESIDVNGKRDTTIGKDDTVNVTGKRTTQIGKDEQLEVGKKLLVTAADEIVLKSGQGSITIKKDGTITIKGKDVKIDASGKINGKASSDIVLKGSKVTQN